MLYHCYKTFNWLKRAVWYCDVTAPANSKTSPSYRWIGSERLQYLGWLQNQNLFENDAFVIIYGFGMLEPFKDISNKTFRQFQSRTVSKLDLTPASDKLELTKKTFEPFQSHLCSNLSRAGCRTGSQMQQTAKLRNLGLIPTWTIWSLSMHFKPVLPKLLTWSGSSVMWRF